MLALLWRLRFLVEVEFYLMLKTDTASELRRIAHAASQYGVDPKASGLHRLYVRVADDHIKFLPALLHYCPYSAQSAEHYGTLSGRATMPSS
ncbi:hypothetical protein HPB52_006580 [Rhipicephalus sanguineus]|uniref:Homing endonuclease LAGLIDADG domain-containing protein n=1 Tax=Rhipicephalus sanguineus TaxID=34632 RepID=A0A9D4PHD2_RHISA|nr:hypothetical protein HPB52_006580 [Rhipicephalus sanguineus]